MQVPLVYETYQDVEQRAFAFDLKNYIQESVREQTEPLLLKTNQYLTTVTRLRGNLVNLTADYEDHKQATDLALNDCVRLLEFRMKLAALEKRIGIELNQVQDDLGKLDKVVEKHDAKLDKHTTELVSVDMRLLRLSDRADAVVTYSNIVSKKLEEQSSQLRVEMAARHDDLRVLFMDLDSRFEGQNVQIEVNKSLC